ncbi:MAG TPA: transketolase [Stellaceae bacterium]|nr:transketolase [Stellaceae bacterium]
MLSTTVAHRPSPESIFAALEQRARRIRATCIQMAADGRQGHLSSALSCTDILVALHSGWLKLSPASIKDPARDRFLFSKGHACTAYYALLAELGFIERQLLASYAKNDSVLINHPCRHALPALEISSGSLGHGLGMATGMLYGLRLKGIAARGVVLMSDGECNEGSVWEAAMFAAAQQLDRLVAIVDYNGLQAVGRSDVIMGHMPLEEKFRAFGWAAETVDGHDLRGLVATLDRLPFAAGKPSAIIARTRGGQGVSFMTDRTLWHYRVPSSEEVEAALGELGVRPIHRSHP